MNAPIPALTWLRGDVVAGMTLAASRLGDTQYERDGNDLQSRGFYLDVPPWQCQIFEMIAA